jgi:hypothetical protein
MEYSVNLTFKLEYSTEIIELIFLKNDIKNIYIYEQVGLKKVIIQA